MCIRDRISTVEGVRTWAKSSQLGLLAWTDAVQECWPNLRDQNAKRVPEIDELIPWDDRLVPRKGRGSKWTNTKYEKNIMCSSLPVSLACAYSYTSIYPSHWYQRLQWEATPRIISGLVEGHFGTEIIRSLLDCFSREHCFSCSDFVFPTSRGKGVQLYTYAHR